ncbi:MAG TPA: molybdopterin-dependent oxidoreductase [Actinomycetota bacterium]|nr:molybdopterin-dependent oxidoreductase [Actinomycetota bacterium]
MEKLPPGQQKRPDFPRFGMPSSAGYKPSSHPMSITIGGEIEEPFEIPLTDLAGLTRVEQVSDLHCVTTWSATELHWSGYGFSEFWNALIAPRMPSETPIPSRLVFKGDDRYWSSLAIEDALSGDVLIADMLNGKPLDLDHGAPIRLVAPSHYGYKSVKHLAGIDFRSTFKGSGMLEHPRARVAFEERGRVLPGTVLRYLYRPSIGPIVKKLS